MRCAAEAEMFFLQHRHPSEIERAHTMWIRSIVNAPKNGSRVTDRGNTAIAMSCDKRATNVRVTARILAWTVTVGRMTSRITFEMHTDPELLLFLAKAGSSPALVRLLERYRGPLVEQARGRVGRRLRVKLDIEDLLQDVSLEAYRDIGRFRGSTEGEFVCWLRKILATILMNHLRHYFGTGRRNLRRDADWPKPTIRRRSESGIRLRQTLRRASAR